MNRVLFILKSRDNYSELTSCYALHSSGLYNSARFVVDMLNKSGTDAKIVEVLDNNSIDREVSLYKPTHVIIEALWVVPEKFEILTKLHPTVKWIVRGHSEIPFIANESVAIDWIFKYLRIPNVRYATNSERSFIDFSGIVGEFDRCKILYLPNFYPIGVEHYNSASSSRVLNVGCFGAIRPLKNNLIQAVAAIRYADEKGTFLKFHVNSGRAEQGGSSNLENLRKLFHHTRYTLVEHSWQEHEYFLDLLSRMDVSLAVSFSETFNIVAADSVACGVPLVCSSEVHWASRFSYADPNSTRSISKAIGRVTNKLTKPWITSLNRKSLIDNVARARKDWLRALE
jgi:hypothetical protein